MRCKIVTTLCLSILLLFCWDVSLGCSILLKPLKEFDKSQYVFIGEVVDIVGKDVAEGIEGEAIGLRVKVTEMIYSPDPSAPYFEVFPLGLTPSCGSMYWERDDIHRQFPVGSQVKVIAGGATVLDRDRANSAIRLEVTAENRGSISRNDLGEGLKSSADSGYDYKSFTERGPTPSVGDPLFWANRYLPQFELRKDWLRLMNAQSEQERIKILERLVYYPDPIDIDYSNIARAYVRDAETLNQLDKKWQAWVEWVHKNSYLYRE